MTTTIRPMAVAFPRMRYAERPMKNFQSCSIVYADDNPERATPLAGVNRSRKTRRSAWAVEVRPYQSLPWMPPAELRAYTEALLAAVEAIEWPDPEGER
jgi:hypothetical protein